MESNVGNMNAFALALAAFVPGLVSLYLQYKREKVQAKQEIAKQHSADEKAAVEMEQARIIMSKQLWADAMSLINPLKAEIKELREQVERQDRRIRHLSLGVYKLIAQIEGSGGIPVWKPAEDLDE